MRCAHQTQSQSPKKGSVAADVGGSVLQSEPPTPKMAWERRHPCRPHAGRAPAKVFHVAGAANVLAESLKNLRRGPPPVIDVPVGESEIAALAVTVGRQVPPGFPHSAFPARRQNAKG